MSTSESTGIYQQCARNPRAWHRGLFAMKHIPWCTLSFAALAVAVHGSPELTNGWQFDRAAIASGESWRFLTAHLTHFGVDHLRWDVLAFVVLGTIAEWISRARFLATVASAGVLITLGVGLAQPQFLTYRGLSGIDSALFGYVVARLIAYGRRARDPVQLALGAVALGGFGLKCAFELATGSTLFVDTGGAFAPVPLAHLLGLACGVIFSGCRNTGGRARA